MKVNILTLCDFAQDNNGKLTVVGIYDLIVTKKVPFTKSLFFVARICFAPEDTGKKYEVKIDIQSQKNQTPLIAPIANEFSIETSDKDVYCNLIFELGRFAFPTDGIYNFKLKVDDKVYTTSLNVKLQNQNS